MSILPLEDDLVRIRGYAKSQISLQIQQATLLETIESTLKDAKAEIVPAAYFGTLVSLLGRKDAPPAVISLLAVILPHLSVSLVTSKADILASRILPHADEESDTSIVRSAITILEYLLINFQPSAWDAESEDGETLPVLIMSNLLSLAADSRPKIRKRATEAVASVLSSLKEMYPDKFIRMSALNLSALAAEKMLDSPKDEPAQTMHALQLIESIASVGWPTRKLDVLIENLLSNLRSSHQFVVSSVFRIFTALLARDEESTGAIPLEEFLATVLRGAPAKLDKQFAPAWFALLALIFGAMGTANPKALFASILDLFDQLQPYLESTPVEVSESAGQCMVALIENAIKPDLVLRHKSSKDILQALAKKLFSLLQANYQPAWEQVFAMHASFLLQASYAAPLQDNLRVLGVLRSGSNLSPQAARGLNGAIAAAIRAFGPEVVVQLIPLQLSAADATGRAWMLPLLRDNIRGTNLAFFTTYFLPLAKELGASATSMQNEKNVKILQTVEEQIWSLLPHFMDLPKDTANSFNKDFMQFLISSLYEFPERRVLIAKGLSNIYNSNLAWVNANEEDIAQEDILAMLRVVYTKKNAQMALKHIQGFSEEILKSLLNVAGQSTQETRAAVFDAVGVYVESVSKATVNEMFDQISNVLATSIHSGDNKTTLSMLDVLPYLTGYIDSSSHDAFINMFKVLAPNQSEPLIQKRIYRALLEFATSESGSKLLEERLDDVLALMLELAPTTLAPARRNRLLSLVTIMENLPKDKLHYVTLILPEAILATKDSNDKTRDASFALLTQMGKAMKDGGVVDHGKIDFFDDDDQVSASLSEYFAMVLGGLLGNTPHMQSATITAAASLLYIFKDDLTSADLLEISDTVWAFLSSASREIVKSVLGFVKVASLVLPREDLEPQLPELLNGLMNWKTETKQHFKSKVRHIVERLLRRFGYETLSRVFPTSDIKLLDNIHKSKERAKRKTAGGAEKKERVFDDELEEALYASSDDSGSDDEPEAEPTTKNGRKFATPSRKKAGKPDQYIMNTNEPLDLLDRSALTQISTTKPGTQKTKELKHKLRERDGRIIIPDENDDGDELDGQSAIAAYVDAVRQGPVRTQRGKLKFKRGKRAQGESDDEDDEPQSKPIKQFKRRPTQKGKPQQQKRRRL